MSVIFSENKYPIAKDISWDDAIEKISEEYLDMVIIGNIGSNCLPTFFLRRDYYPGTIGEAFKTISEDCGVKVLHTYISLAENSKTFGSHYDPVDVLIVQAKGTISYLCDNITYTLNPGDSLFIPKGTYHEPIVPGPRVTLSFSWE